MNNLKKFKLFLSLLGFTTLSGNLIAMDRPAHIPTADEISDIFGDNDPGIPVPPRAAHLVPGNNVNVLVSPKINSHGVIIPAVTRPATIIMINNAYSVKVRMHGTGKVKDVPTKWVRP